MDQSEISVAGATGNLPFFSFSPPVSSRLFLLAPVSLRYEHTISTKQKGTVSSRLFLLAPVSLRYEHTISTNQKGTACSLRLLRLRAHSLSFPFPFFPPLPKPRSARRSSFFSCSAISHDLSTIQKGTTCSLLPLRRPNTQATFFGGRQSKNQEVYVLTELLRTSTLFPSGSDF